jgi:hypothetical protein
MAKNQIVFEKDEKKSIIIALIVSAVLILAIVLTFVAIKKYRSATSSNQTSVTTNTTTTNNTNTTTEDGDEVVKTQKSLNAALKGDSKSIVYRTKKEGKITIPSGKYTEKAITIDAPYTEVTNKGVFSSVTITQIAQNTWTENTSGNSIIVNSPACHIIVSPGATVNSIQNKQANSTLAVEVQGTVNLMSLDAADSITSIKVDGDVLSTLIYASTNLSLSGGKTSSMNIEMEYGSDGSVITTTIPVAITTFAGCEITTSPSAEGSTLKLSNAAVTVKITNNSSGDNKVTTTDGKEEVIVSGSSKSWEGTQTATTDGSQTAAASSDSASSSSTGSSGSSTSGSSSGSSSGTSGSGSSSSGRSTRSSSGTSSSGSSATSNSSQPSSGSTSSQSTASTYTQADVEAMVKSAVESATKGLLTEDVVNQRVAAAVADAIKGLISETDAQAKIDKAVSDATSGMISKDEATELANKAVKKVLSSTLVIGFEDENNIYARQSDGSLMTDAMVKAKLMAEEPELKGKTVAGDIVKIGVSEWVNTDNYSEYAVTGQYTYTAVAKDGNYYIAGGVEGHVEVFVIDQTTDSDGKKTDTPYGITFADNSYESLISVAAYKSENYNKIISGNIAETAAYYYLKYSQSATSAVYVGLKFYYFNDSGKEIECDVTDGKYLQPGQGMILKREHPCIKYKYCTVEVQAKASTIPVVSSQITINIVDNVITVYKNDTSAGEISEVELTCLVQSQGIARSLQTFKTTDINDHGVDNGLQYTVELPEDVSPAGLVVTMSGGCLIAKN